MVRLSFVILFSMIITKGAYASFAVPDHMLGIKKFAKDFRKPIIDKLLQMRQNFIERNYKKGTRFISNEKVTCPFGISVEALNNLATYTYTTNVVTDNETGKVTSYENRFLRGCARKNTVTEKIKIIGKKAFINDHASIMQGQLNLQMNKGEKEIVDYRMIDSAGVQIMRIYSKVTGNERITNLYLGNQKFIQIFYKRLNENLEVRYKFYSADFILNRNGFEYSSHIEARSNGYFKAIINDRGPIQYFNDKGIQVSFGSFQKFFQLNGINFIMNSVLFELPVTDFVSTGGGSARLKEELRNAQIWLIGGNPAQINLVKNLIQEYIQAVEKNLLIDNRPKKQ